MEKRREYFPDGYLIKYASHYRISKDEICQVYRGYEIASHGMFHRATTGLNEAELMNEIILDTQELSRLSGTSVSGVAFAKGKYNQKVLDFLRRHDIAYARGIQNTNAFAFPSDPLQWNPTCSMLSNNLFELFDVFEKAEKEEDMLLYVWGHGYEFDYASQFGNWDRLRRICEKIADNPNVISCTNREIIQIRSTAIA